MAAGIGYILLITLAALTTASLYDPSANRKLEKMKKLVDILHNKLISEKCPDPDERKVKRFLFAGDYIRWNSAGSSN